MAITPDHPMDKKRREILRTVTEADLKWDKIRLKYDPDRSIEEAPFSIKVCRVVSKNNIFIPVTADEVFALAKRWKAYPLTGAVMDQMVNNKTVEYVARKIMDPNKEILEFEKYSKFLAGTAYSNRPAIGAHKLWIISSKGRRVNHGFQFKGKIHHKRPKFLEKGWDAIQISGAAHEHEVYAWDYSQLLQLMKDFRNERDGIDLPLERMIKAFHPALWDDEHEKEEIKRLP